MNSQNQTKPPENFYAGFWIRVAAYVVDYLILLPTLLLYYFFEHTTAGALQFMLIVLYSAFLESSEWQATLGKKMFGMKVTDTEQNRISFLKAVARAVLISLSFFFPLLFVVVAFSERKRGLHDMVCETLVFRNEVINKDIKMEFNFRSKG